MKGGRKIVTTIYLCFLAGGVVLPFISFIAGSIGDGMDTDGEPDLDLDMETDIEIGGDIDSFFSIGLFPSSLMSLSALAITFGATGGIMSHMGKGKIITFIAAIALGYIVAVIVQTIIKTLKRIQERHYGINENEILLYNGKVVDTILPGQLGSVSFYTLKNVMVSYPAKCSDENIKLEVGRIVKVKEIIKGVCIVEPINKYE